MTCKFAPNGEKSKVYNEIIKNFNGKLANEVFVTTHTPKFRQWFRDWRQMADGLVMQDSNSYKSIFTRVQNRMDLITNPITNEPIVFYTKGEVVPLLDVEIDAPLQRLLDILPAEYTSTDSSIEDNYEVDRAFVVTDKYEIGSTPIFIRNNNIVLGNKTDLLRYNNSIIKDKETGTYFLYDTGDAVYAQDGSEIDFNQTTIKDTYGLQIAKSVSNQLDKVSISADDIENTYIFEEGYLATNYANIQLEHTVFETLAPSIVETIFIESPLKFENLYNDLVESIDTHDSIVEEINQLYPNKTLNDKRKDILTNSLISLFKNPINNTVTTYRMNNLYRDFTGELNQVLSGFDVNVTEQSSFADLLADIESTPLNTNTTELGSIVDNMINYEEALGAPVVRDPMDQAVEEFRNLVVFDDSIILDEDGNPVTSPHTGIPEIKHDYYDAITAEHILYSVSDLKKEFDILKFDKVRLFWDKMQIGKYGGSPTAKRDVDYIFNVTDEDGKFNVKETQDKRLAFIKAVLAGDVNKYAERYPFSGELEKLKVKYPMRTETIGDPENDQGYYEDASEEAYVNRLKSIFKDTISIPWHEFMWDLRDWQTRTFVGTKFHRMAEAILREEQDRTDEFRDKDIAILKALDNIPNKIKALNKRIFKIEKEYRGVITPTERSMSVGDKIDALRVQFDKVKAYEAENSKDTTTNNDESGRFQKGYHSYEATLDNIASQFYGLDNQLQLYKDLKDLKAHIKSNGGTIKVEVNLTTDKVINHEGDNIRIAGQADVLVIYENKESVNPDFRGKFEIYDFKTTKWEMADSPLLYSKSTHEGHDTIKGMSPQKQMGHAYQQLTYARAVEVELGFEFKDAYIVPVYIPYVNARTFKMVGTKSKPFGIPFTEHGKLEGDSDLVVNIRSFKGATVMEHGVKVRYLSFNELQELTKRRIPSGTTYDGKEAKANQSTAETKLEERTSRRKKSQVDELISDIEKYIQRRIDAIKVTDSKESRSKLKGLQAKLEDFEDLHKLWRFTTDAMDDILGSSSEDGEILIKSLVDVVKEAELLYYQENTPKQLAKTIKTLDDVRLHVQSYKELLNRAKTIFDNATGEELVAIKSHKDYKRLDKTIAAINDLENNYFDLAKELMAERLFKYASKTGQQSVDLHFAAQEDRLNTEIESLQIALENANSPEETAKITATIEKRKARLKGINVKTEDLTITKDSILNHLNQLPYDISYIQRYLLAPISSSDHILALYAKMLKFNIMDAEISLQKKGVDMQTFIDNFLEKLGKKNIEYDSETFFEPILETRNIWVTVTNENGEREKALRPVSALVDEYGVRKHTLANGELVELGYKEIINDFRFRLNEFRRDSNFDEYKKLKKDFESWMRDNMEDAYVKEYYELEKVWTEDSIGIEAKLLRDEFDDQINEIRNDSGSEFELNKDEKHEIAKLRSKKRALASMYTESGKLKSLEEIAIAKKIQKFSELNVKLHDFDSNYDLFEHKKTLLIKHIQDKYRKLGITIPAEQTPEYFEWLSENQDTYLTDKFYNRYNKLKLERDLQFYAAYHKNLELKKFLNSREAERSNDVDFATKAQEILKGQGLTVDDLHKTDAQSIEVSELNDKINQLIKPYKIGKYVDYSLVPKSIFVKIKQIQNKIQNIYADSDFKSLPKEEADKLLNALSIRKIYQSNLDDFGKYEPTNKYWKHYYENKAIAEDKGLDLEDSTWFKRNHIFNPRTTRNEPIRIWQELLHTKASILGTESNKYRAQKQEVLKSLMLEYPDRTNSWYKEKLKKSKWYTKHHDVSGTIKRSSRYLQEVDPDNVFTKVRPSAAYSTFKVKEKYIRDTQLSRDENGDLLPKKNKWVNKKYKDIQKSSTWKYAHDNLLGFFKDAQSILPQEHRMGNILPFTRKASKEILAGKKGIVEKAKATGKLIKETLLISNAFDLEDEGDKTMYNLSLDHKKIPMPFTKSNYAVQEEVSKDVISGVMQYVKAAYKHQAIDDMMSETRMLMSLVDKREGQDGKGVIRRDSMGNKFFDSIAKKLNKDSEELVRADKQSLASGLLKDFIEMQILGEMNKPYEIAIPWYDGSQGKLRVDKVVDGFMQYASITQIGGLNMVGVLKGAANSLQAQLQVAIEKSAGKYFDKNSWRDAMSFFRKSNTVKEAWQDFGRAFNTTLSGQMRSIYDPMQGDFLDQYGAKIAGNKIQRMMSTSTWFFNQYAGEFQIAMASMYALQNNYKIVDGEVYNRDEFIEMKRIEALDKNEAFGFSEKLFAEQEFKSIASSLRDAYELKDGHISIKEGVNWQIGSNRDKEMKSRLHAINKALQGNYNSFDQPTIQRNWLGRLLIMYKKYLVPGMLRRFGGIRRDEELGDLTYGYYRNFFKLMVHDTKALWGEYYNNVLKTGLTAGKAGGDFDSKLSDLERENIRRAAKELTSLLMLFMLVAVMAPGDDEDKSKISSTRYTALYLAERLKKEVSSMSPNPVGLVADNWKLLRSPSAISGFVDRFLKLIVQVGDPTATYAKDTGIAEKGDNKLYIKARKLMGTLALPGFEPTTSREAFENLNRFM